MSWQSSTSLMKDKLLYLQATKEMCDVNLIIGQEKELFTTHAFLLSMFSEVFRVMFCGSTTRKMFDFYLPDDKVEAFRIFLEYVYTDNVNIRSVDEAISSILFAEKYLIKYMADMSTIYLENNISPNSAFRIYEIACTMQKTELKCKCWQYIAENTSAVIKQEHVNHVTFKTMLDIVSNDNLALDSEIDIYDAVIRWGKQKYPRHSSQSLRDTLDPLLRQIRFLTMTSEQFAGSPTKDNILTINEKLDIFKAISRPSLTNYEYTTIVDQWRKPRNYFQNLKKNKLFTVTNFIQALEKFQLNDRNTYLTGLPFYVEYYPPANNASNVIYKVRYTLFNIATETKERIGCNGVIKIFSNSNNTLVRERKLVNIKMSNTCRADFGALSVYITLNINSNLYILIKDRLQSHSEGTPPSGDASYNQFCPYIRSSISYFVNYIKSKRN